VLILDTATFVPTLLLRLGFDDNVVYPLLLWQQRWDDVVVGWSDDCGPARCPLCGYVVTGSAGQKIMISQ
jgi:hypothetical protein